MIGVTGFEPTAPWSQTTYTDTLLSHTTQTLGCDFTSEAVIIVR